MTVLGGRGSISGVMLAAAILTALPEFLRDFEQYRLIVYALLLIAMMLLRPQGLFGIHEIWQVWKRRSEQPASAMPSTNHGRNRLHLPLVAPESSATLLLRRRAVLELRRLEGGAEFFAQLAVAMLYTD